jgi:hypothetical protein
VTSIRNEDIPSNILFSNSELIGSNEIIFTSSVLEMLRKHKWVENNLSLHHPEFINKETGHLSLKLSLKSISIDSKVYEDNKEIEECFFDPFEKDKETIKEKMQKTIVLNEEKQSKLEKKAKELEQVNRQYKTLAVEKQKLVEEITTLEEENNLLRRNLIRLQNYDEIHIEVDILSQSKQGVEILEKKYAILLSQLSLQSETRYELDLMYEEMDPKLSKIKIVKDKTSELQNANEELKFNIKRQEDMLPLITNYEEKIKSNEKLINNYRESVQTQIQKNEEELRLHKVGDTYEDLDIKISALYQERKLLEEKHMQMKLYQRIWEDCEETHNIDKNNSYSNPNAYSNAYSKFCSVTGNGLDLMMNHIVTQAEDTLMTKYKTQINEMNQEVYSLTEKLEQINKREKVAKENAILIDPNIKYKKQEMMYKIETVENREKALIQEIDSADEYFRYTINKMRSEMEKLDKIIEKEVNYAQSNNYYHNDFY